MRSSVLSWVLCRAWLATLAGLLALGAPVQTQAQSMGPDVKGGTDHPLVSRFAGSQMVGYQQLEFDAGRFFLPNKASGYDPAKEIDMEKPVVTEGKVTRLIYVAPAGKTALEVHRNFEQALKAAGLKVLTSVDGRNAWWNPGQHLRANFADVGFQSPFASDISPFDREGLYVYGTLSRGGVDVSVSVLTGPVSLFARGHYKTDEKTAQAAVAIQIVEPKAMTTGQVTVSADAIGKGLDADGRIALYGIYFDTGKADIKPESRAQLDQMAAILKARPALRVHIVGHTDNVGSLDANLALSLKRAEAVVAALVNTHRVDAKRLSARGVASLSPVTGNRTEAGRALNRRVEMVEQ
jgi:OmpA-OmpF porin, OOP family